MSEGEPPSKVDHRTYIVGSDYRPATGSNPTASAREQRWLFTNGMQTTPTGSALALHMLLSNPYNNHRNETETPFFTPAQEVRVDFNHQVHTLKHNRLGHPQTVLHRTVYHSSRRKFPAYNRGRKRDGRRQGRYYALRTRRDHEAFGSGIISQHRHRVRRRCAHTQHLHNTPSQNHRIPGLLWPAWIKYIRFKGPLLHQWIKHARRSQ